MRFAIIPTTTITMLLALAHADSSSYAATTCHPPGCPPCFMASQLYNSFLKEFIINRRKSLYI